MANPTELLRRDDDLEKFIRYLSRAPSDESADNRRRRVINAFLTKANTLYGLERSALLKVEESNNGVKISAIQGVGPLTSDQHKQVLANLYGKSLDDILRGYDPKKQTDTDWNNYLGTHMRGFSPDINSIISKVVKDKLSYEGGNSQDLTCADKPFLTQMDVNQFIAIAIKGPGVGQEDKVTHILYGDRKFSGQDFSVDKNRIAAYKDFISYVLQSIDNQEIAETKSRIDAEMDTLHRIIHEIYSPTIQIEAFANRLRKRKDLPPKAEVDINQLYNNAIRLKKFITVFKQANTARLIPKKEEVNLYHIIESAILDIPSEDRCDYQVSDFKTDLKVYADPDYLQGAIRNVASNAFKAMRDDLVNPGELRISCTKDETSLYLHLTNKQSMRNEIRDCAMLPGITSDSSTGMGLGLSITKMYMEANGGSVSYSSNKEEGTTFILQFPLNGR